MVLDTSALLAVYFTEPDSERFEAAIVGAPQSFISAGTLLETGIVVEARRGEAGSVELDRLLLKLGVTTVPVDAEQVEIGRVAFRTYGKGRHAAALNHGDCFAYALAITTSDRLLFKGDDFSQTDVVDALGDA